MIDFYSFDESSIPFRIKALFWGLYIVVFIYAVWKTQLKTPKDYQKMEVSGLFGVFFTLYAVFYCVNPDYFNYRAWLSVTDTDDWIKEKFYIYLALFCRRIYFNHPYELFRLIVWGGGVTIAYLTFRLYRQLLLPGLTLLLLFIFHSSTFCYARASLAMAVYFFGIAIYLLRDKRRLKLLGIAIALASIFLHREMFIGIAVLPFLFIPFEKKGYLFFSIILLFIVIIVISFAGSNPEFMNLIYDEEAEIATKIDNINNREQGAFRLSTFINYLKYFFSFYLITRYVWKKKPPRSIIGVYRVTYGVLMASVAFMVEFGLRSIYTYRILYISMIPLTLLIGYGYSRHYFTKMQFLILMVITLLANSIRFVNAQ